MEYKANIFYLHTIISTMTHSYLDKKVALIYDNQQFICSYGNVTALKLQANNMKKK